MHVQIGFREQNSQFLTAVKKDDVNFILFGKLVHSYKAVLGQYVKILCIKVVCVEMQLVMIFLRERIMLKQQVWETNGNLQK